MRVALRVETWKLTRSRVTLVATTLLGLLLPAMGLGFYTVAVAGGTGSLADKAAALLIGEGWAGFFGFVDQIAAVALFVGSGIVVAWVFGREHIDGTFPALFALPISRGTIAAAKFVVLTVWVVLLALIVAAVTLTLGIVGGVGPWETTVIVAELARLLAVSLGAGALALTMGLVASIGRGYLAAIGALSVIIAVAQIAVLFGSGGWFPFAVPGLLAVAEAPGIPALTPAQVSLVPVVALVSVALTVRWWQGAEVA